jgi:hypothetical protein
LTIFKSPIASEEGLCPMESIITITIIIITIIIIIVFSVGPSIVAQFLGTPAYVFLLGT